MYEGEYDPRLPPNPEYHRPIVGEDPDSNGNPDDYHYVFPHTCPDGHGPSRYMTVCPHHTCRNNTCEDQCVNFVCEECCPDYEPEAMPAAGDAKHMLLHTQIYHIGDKYGIVGLKQLATEKFTRACAHFWYTEHFAPAVRHAFTSTPESDRNLRDSVANTISETGSLINRKEFESLLVEFPKLAVAVLTLKANPGKEWRSVLAELNYGMQE